MVIDPVEQHAWGWAFPSSNPADRLAGQFPAPPLLVDRFTAAVIELDRDEPLEVQVARYEESGWPRRR